MFSLNIQVKNGLCT